jgi:hypothetical protein
VKIQEHAKGYIMEEGINQVHASYCSLYNWGNLRDIIIRDGGFVATVIVKWLK